MRRPLPPDLVALGDELETATARAVGDRPGRRQRILNLVATVVIAVPLMATLSTRPAPQPEPRVTPTPTVAPAEIQEMADVPPRIVQTLLHPDPVPDPRGALR